MVYSSSSWLPLADILLCYTVCENQEVFDTKMYDYLHMLHYRDNRTMEEKRF